MITTIQAVQYPFFITTCGMRIRIGDVLGSARPGSTIEQIDDGWKVKGVGDPNCEI